MKKVQNIVIHILIAIIVILLQIYVFNNINFFGTQINFIIVYIAIITIFKDISWALTTSIIMGITIDILFNAPLFKYTVIYFLIFIAINGVNSKYRKESKVALIYIVGIATLIFEIMEYIFCILNKGIFIDIFSFMLFVTIGIFVNFLLAIVFRKVYNIINIE